MIPLLKTAAERLAFVEKGGRSSETGISDRHMEMTEVDTLLLQLGILLFLLGLLTGLVIPRLSNPSMGLSSHLEGVLNGMFLVVLGLLWRRLNLSNTWLTITFWRAVYGTFANWLATFLADSGQRAHSCRLRAWAVTAHQYRKVRLDSF